MDETAPQPSQHPDSGPTSGNSLHPNPLQSSPAQFTSLSEDVFELIQEGVAVLDPDFSIHTANPSFRRLLGLEMSVLARVKLTDHPILAAEISKGPETKPLSAALLQMLDNGDVLDATDVDVKVPGSDTPERFCIQAKRRAASPGNPPRILLWIKPSEPVSTPSPGHSADSSAATSMSSGASSIDLSASESGPISPAAALSADETANHLIHALDLLTHFNQLCSELLETALRMSGGGSGSLMLTHENGRELSIVASRGISDPVVRSTRLLVGEGIAGRVAETGEPLLLPGRVGDSRFRGTGGRQGICSSVCAPIKADQVVLGVLNVNATEGGKEFDETTRDQLAAFAGKLGAVVQHARQYQAMRFRSHQLTIRAEIEAVAFSKEDLDNKLRQTLSSIERLLTVDTFSIYLADTEARTLQLTASSGVDSGHRPHVTVPFGVGLPGWVAEHGTPVSMNGLIDGKSGSSTGISNYGVPIKHNDELIGVIVMESSSEDDSVNLEEVARVIATALAHVIRDAEAQDESNHKMTLLSALSEIGLAMTDSPDPSSFAKLTSYCAVTLLETDITLVRLARGSMPRSEMKPADLELQATHGISAPEADHPMTRLEERLIQNVIESAEVKLDVDVASEEMTPLLQQADVKSAVCIPMISGDALIGTITAFRIESAPSSRENETDIGERLGDYAAAAARRFVLTNAA